MLACDSRYTSAYDPDAMFNQRHEFLAGSLMRALCTVVSVLGRRLSNSNGGRGRREEAGGARWPGRRGATE